jgi:capsular polysaccharide transport system ATP-binding protein
MLDSNPLFERPLREFPREDLRLLGAIMALSLPFDIYLLSDDILRDGDGIRTKCHALCRLRMETAGVVVSTRNARFAQQNCDMALVLHEGRLTRFETVDEAFAELMTTSVSPRL